MGDYDDIRAYFKASAAGIERAISCGAKYPVLLLPSTTLYGNAPLVSALGAFSSLYVPIQYREDCPEDKEKVNKIGFYLSNDFQDQVISQSKAIEIAINIARDIGGADPERMSAMAVEKYVYQVFQSSSVVLKVHETDTYTL